MAIPGKIQRSADKTTYWGGDRSPGLSDVGSYQQAGTPYLTGSDAFADGTEHVHIFPKVSKKIIVFNQGQNDIRIHFNSDDKGPVASEHHYLTLSGTAGDAVDTSKLELEVKCPRIYLSNESGGTATYELFAELTGIEAGEMIGVLTGSGLTSKTGGGSNPA